MGASGARADAKITIDRTLFDIHYGSDNSLGDKMIYKKFRLKREHCNCCKFKIIRTNYILKGTALRVVPFFYFGLNDGNYGFLPFYPMRIFAAEFFLFELNPFLNFSSLAILFNVSHSILLFCSD
jgi:hypothetical protein